MTLETQGTKSTTSIILFVLASTLLLLLILTGQMLAWFLEQNALASDSLAVFASAGKVWFVIQDILVAGSVGLFFVIPKNVFRPIYRSWLLAVLFTLPGFGFRFLGPNDDQVGAFLQILLGLLAGTVILLIDRHQIQFDRRIWFALALIPLAIWPFLLWGALGSGTDIILSLLAGLAFGYLSASLIVTPAENYFQDGLGIAVLLAILGSSFGYDGGQLLLLVVLPAFGFVLVKLARSFPATALMVGLLAAAPLVFIDPTELTILLGDLLPWAEKAAFSMTGLGIVIGFLVWQLSRGNKQLSFHPTLGALVTWVLAAVLYGFFGLHGFNGDRLFVILKDQADVSQAVNIPDRTQRLTYVYKTLTDYANKTQADLRTSLDRYGIHYTPYYLVNGLEVDGGAIVRLYLMNRGDVDRVLPSQHLRPIPHLAQPLAGDLTSIPGSPTWNIQMIGADRVWQELGVTGKGIVVGQSDSGVDGTHPALQSTYRGLNQGNDYNWYDPWANSRSPNDQFGHGTHTLGIVLGQDGIGVAPGAQWIGCVNLERGIGNPPYYLDCMQFMLAPFPQGGDPFKDGDPSRAAEVLNDSWGCPPLEGCDAEALRPAAQALKAAGIFVVASTGNDGPFCGTIKFPLSLYDSVLSVGAVDQSGSIAIFSSRGPVTIDGSNRTKPDIAAPGVGIVSALPGGLYGSEEGTSMAGPHVAGVVALMWSANPALIGNIDRTTQILEQTAKPRVDTDSLGGCSSSRTPNDAYGYGIVNAYAAVKMALAEHSSR